MPYLLEKTPYWITRFGEMGIVLPLAAVLTLWIASTTRTRGPVLRWLLPLGLAIGITSLSKIAFIGWGIGIAALDFTGFSGHAMFSAAIYPVLAYTLATQGNHARHWHRNALLAGYGLALLIAWSRVHIEVHSWSEVVAGFVLGASASGWTVWCMAQAPIAAHPRPQRWMLLGLAGWLAVMPLHAAPSRSHDMVTRLALTLSDHGQAFKRTDLHRATP